MSTTFKISIEDIDQPRRHRLRSIESTRNIIKNVDNHHDTLTEDTVYRHRQIRRSHRNHINYKHFKTHIEVDYQQEVSDQRYIGQQRRHRPSSLKYDVDANRRPNQQMTSKSNKKTSINNIGQHRRH